MKLISYWSFSATRISLKFNSAISNPIYPPIYFFFATRISKMQLEFIIWEPHRCTLRWLSSNRSSVHLSEIWLQAKIQGGGTCAILICILYLYVISRVDSLTIFEDIIFIIFENISPIFDHPWEKFVKLILKFNLDENLWIVLMQIAFNFERISLS